MSITSNGNGSIPATGIPSKTKMMPGREVAAWVARASMLTKLCVGAAIVNGEVKITDHTVTQVARMIGVKTAQLKAVAALSSEQRAGLSTKRRVTGARLSDSTIDELIIQVGPLRMMAALDRATAPHTVAAE
jgi:hypothetical protein